jgi:hypothetical protein
MTALECKSQEPCIKVGKVCLTEMAILTDLKTRRNGGHKDVVANIYTITIVKGLGYSSTQQNIRIQR